MTKDKKTSRTQTSHRFRRRFSRGAFPFRFLESGSNYELMFNDSVCEMSPSFSNP